MKHKIFLLLLSCVVSFSASAQLLSYEELQKQVAVMNAQMPMSMGYSMQMTSVMLTKDAIVYRGAFNTPVASQPTNTTKVDEQAMRENVKKMIVCDESVRAFFKSLIALNIGVTYVYSYNAGKNEITVSFTPQELSEIIEKSASDESKANIIINGMKSSLPMRTMIGITIVNIQKNGQWIEYIAEVDETLWDVEEIEKEKAIRKESMLSMMKNDMLSMQQIGVFVGAGYGMKYIYRGSVTHQEVVIALTQQELSELVIANQAEE